MIAEEARARVWQYAIKHKLKVVHGADAIGVFIAVNHINRDGTVGEAAYIGSGLSVEQAYINLAEKIPTWRDEGKWTGRIWSGVLSSFPYGARFRVREYPYYGHTIADVGDVVESLGYVDVGPRFLITEGRNTGQVVCFYTDDPRLVKIEEDDDAE